MWSLFGRLLHYVYAKWLVGGRFVENFSTPKMKSEKAEGEIERNNAKYY